ncbi:MAG: GNAT family N-acetyltransferase [Alphaproteobacteria bacterium]|nr:GNAT family N-acetyltransferase [Alphaproteobacteria bacterium]
MTESPALVIRPARPGDTAPIHRLIGALADYEKLRHEMEASVDDLDRALFGEQPYARALIAERQGEPVGYALYFYTFSTFTGRPSLYLEDLFVMPSHRSQGTGRALLARLADIALQDGCGRFEWSVLDWNAPSIRFYESLGAHRHDEWQLYRLTGDELARLASESSRERDHGGE